jgi:hypothetical protein
MRPLEELANALYREEVARARSMTPEDKLLEGPRLFDPACRLMADGVRHRHPELDEPSVLKAVDALLQQIQASIPQP